MTDRAYIISRTLEDKIVIAENNDQNTMFITLDVLKEILTLLKEQESTINELQNAYGYLQKQFFEAQDELLKEREAIKPTINEYGEAYCICGENVGIIPSNKNLPSIRSKYCSECGRRMKWE